MKEMDKISKLLEETQSLLEGFSSGSLSPVSSCYNSDLEAASEGGDLGVREEFRKLLRSGDNSKICKFIESWSLQQQQPLQGALHIAVEEKCKDSEVFKSLLRVGCDPLDLDSNQKTALTLLLEQKEEQSDNDSMFEEDDCTISTLLGEWELRRAATRDSKIFRLIHSRNWKDLYSFLLSTTADPVKLLCKVDAKYAGISPIHEIAALNDVSTLKRLTRKFKGIDFNTKAIGSGNTPLHEATHMTSTEMVSFLLENGAKCDIKNAAGKIPAHLGTEKIQVIIEIKNMTASQEEVKLKKSADPIIKATKSVSASVSVDSLSREERKLKQIIGFLDRIENNNESSDDGDSGDNSGIGDSGESEDFEAEHSNPPANTEDKSSTNGRSSPVNNGNFVDVLERENHSGRTILHRFARRNQSEKLLKFLKEHDFDESKCKSMKLFEVIDNSGSTPLHDAASEGSLEAAKIFLFGGKVAKTKNLLIDPSIPAAITGDTPLHAAASSGNAEIVELLLAVGANKDATNIEGKRAIDVTRSKSVKKLLNPPEANNHNVKVNNKMIIQESTTVVTMQMVEEVPVKRGPGRPRKYPRPDEPIAKQVKTEKSERSENNSNFLSSSPPPPPPQLSNFSFTEIEPNSCLILVKFDRDWLMLFEQFQQILWHLNTENLSTFEDFVIKVTDKSLIKSLPKVGHLVSALQSRESCKFIPKWRALQIIEREFRVHLTGPFGYIDIPRIIASGASDSAGDCSNASDCVNPSDCVSGNTMVSDCVNPSSTLLNAGCPLKLKLKLEKHPHPHSQLLASTWLSSTRNFEEQKSPKSFHM